MKILNICDHMAEFERKIQKQYVTRFKNVRAFFLTLKSRKSSKLDVQS